MLVRWFLLGCGLCVLGLLVGCAAKPVKVSGTVELDGQPLKEGKITLLGEGGATPEGPFDIKDGKFEGEAKPGKKRVEIRAYKMGQPTKMGDKVIEASPENYLPAEYNTESKLTTEIGADGALNPSSFKVKSQ
jgi:hypothetical protein